MTIILIIIMFVLKIFISFFILNFKRCNKSIFHRFLTGVILNIFYPATYLSVTRFFLKHLVLTFASWCSAHFPILIFIIPILRYHLQSILLSLWALHQLAVSTCRIIIHYLFCSRTIFSKYFIL